MDNSISIEVSVPIDDANISAVEDDSSKVNHVLAMPFSGEMNEESTTANEIIARVNSDLISASEKLDNLSSLMMHAAAKESDFESFASANDPTSFVRAKEALELDLLSSLLESEAMEVDKFLSFLLHDTIEVREVISSNKRVGEIIMKMEEMLSDSENSLKRSQDQVSEIVVQSTKLRGALSCLYRNEKGQSDRDLYLLEDGQPDAKISAQTAEQQRNILMLPEKPLAKEMDLEMKSSESKQTEEETGHRLQSVEHEQLFVEEVIEVCERWFEGENAAEVLMGMSKELLGRLQILQFNLNGSVKREAELKAKLEKLIEQLDAKENALQKYKNGIKELNKRLLSQTDNLSGSSLEKKQRDTGSQASDSNMPNEIDHKQPPCSEVSELESLIKDLEERLLKAESRADSAETKCKLLMDTNKGLNEELEHLKDKCGNIEVLERQLKESEMKLQHAMASAEASQERQNMLYSSIQDMETVIENLKSRVLKAENRADSTEDNCIILSESNAELNKELSVLKSRIECLESSLNQAEESKIKAALDIGFKSKAIREMLVQLAIERRRLHKQIETLALENKTLVGELQQTRKDPLISVNHPQGGKVEELSPPELKATQISSAVSEITETQKPSADKTPKADSRSEVENIGRTNVGLLMYKHFLMAGLVLCLSAAAAYLLQQKRYSKYYSSL